ncbi:unnamed protein product [Mytilus coruscus]|uniref:Uncharacterized protein n=1 Tax=Mytilus coruscus TaxID=42192 RepID=A0A6J8BV87_MYTCO|nr:unnamed protein product [Mytilus coruscus]
MSDNIFDVNLLINRRLASNVSINQDINGLLGKNDTHLTCSCIQEKEVRLLSIEIIVKNVTEDFDDKKPIAIFKPGRAAKLHSSGEYLSGRVTLTNITNKSNTAALKFLILRCIDEKDYICKYYVIDMDGAVSTSSIHSEVSDDQEAISVESNYEDIGSVSYHEVNLSNDRIETSNQTITEGEIGSENIHISKC